MIKVAASNSSGRNHAHSVEAIGHDNGTIFLSADGKTRTFLSALEAAEYGDSCFRKKSLLGNQIGRVLISVASQMKAIPFGWRGWDNPEAKSKPKEELKFWLCGHSIFASENGDVYYQICGTWEKFNSPVPHDGKELTKEVFKGNFLQGDFDEFSLRLKDEFRKIFPEN